MIVVIISKFVWGIEFSFHPAFLVPILLESLGMYGIGLIVAGIAIYFKRTGTIVFLIQTALLFVTDTVPTSDAILKITHYIPLTRCNEYYVRSRLAVNIQACCRDCVSWRWCGW